jgi:16S rRNA U1498 N3-methylase RsmE
VAAADPGGTFPSDWRPRTVVIGPEGGWAPGEIPESVTRLDLGTTILRVETAALVAAARLL